MPVPDDIMTVAEVASILKLNHQTVRKLDRPEGSSPCCTSAGGSAARRADFDALIDQSAISRSESEPALATIWDGERSQPQMPGDL